MVEIYPTTKDQEDEQDQKRSNISRAYLDGKYDECLALVIDSLSQLSDSFIQPKDYGP